MQKTFFLADEAATERFANDLAMVLRPGDLVTLSGDLGAGKSTLARAVLRVLAADDQLEVPSPTFTLVQVYEETRFPAAHADLYRVSDPQEIEELGFSEILEDGVILLEWPERAADLLPPPAFQIVFSHEKDGRRVEIKIRDDRSNAFQRICASRSFLQENGYGLAKRLYLAGDASARSYERIIETSPKVLPKVLMDAPAMELPEEGRQSYAKTVHLAPDMAQFVGMDRLLREHGFHAPQIIATDFEHGLLLMEDLGDDGVRDEDGQPIKERYLAAAELLVAVHQEKWPHQKKWDDLTLSIPPYDEGAMMAEVSLLPQWYIPFLKRRKMNELESAQFQEAWGPLIARLQQAPQTLVMRDFHSPNLLWQSGKKGRERLGLIDFQDGLIGPETYDLASLAQDARVNISPLLEKEIVRHYVFTRKELDNGFDETAFLEAYVIMAAQRASKILGIFVRLNERDGKPQYLKHLPRLQGYLARSFTHPVLCPLKKCYEELGIIE